MADRQDSGVLYKKEIKLPASIGDWTNYKPQKASSRKVKPVFYAPQRISRDDLEATLNIHNFFATEFSAYLKDAIKASIDIHSIKLEQMTYLDFLKGVSGGLIYSKMEIKNIGEALLLVDYQLSNMIINFSLGCQSVDTKIKELTELEESIIHSIFNNVLDKYAACWGNIFEKPSIEIISYPNIQRESYINLNDVITVVTMQVSIANSIPSSMTLMFQNNTLKKILDLLARKEEQRTVNVAKFPEEMLTSILIPVIAVLGTTSIATQELTSIEDEDVLFLDQRISEPTTLVLGYSSYLKAQPGIKNNRLAVKMLGSSAKTVKSIPITRPDSIPVEEQLPAAETLAPDAPMKEPSLPAKEDEFDLPLEDAGKEEYNDSSENIFEEENDNPTLGGKKWT